MVEHLTKEEWRDRLFHPNTERKTKVVPARREVQAEPEQPKKKRPSKKKVEKDGI